MIDITYGSVCSGIESASVAWGPIGFRPLWLSEIEPFPCAVLAHHWPQVPNLGDMTKLADWIRIGAVPAPLILVGGTPCQDFSVAGKGASLDGDRGQLTITYGDIANAIDEQRDEGDECVIVWENVPGVLSTKDNAFGYLLGLLAGEFTPSDIASGTARPLEAQPDKSRQKWPKSGCVIGPKRSVAWRVIDAQYFGVAQRRRRVFVVASARKGFDPSKVLFESEGVRRNTAPSREAGQEIAGTLASRTNGGGFPGTDEACSGYVIPFDKQEHGVYGLGKTACTQLQRQSKQATDLVVSTLDASYGRLQGCSGQDLNHGHSHLIVHGTQDPCVSDSVAFALDCNNGAENAVYGFQASQSGVRLNNVAGTLDANYGSRRHNGVLEGAAVRRLTPVECERLQGFPDNHTLLPYGVKQKLDAEMRQYYERHLGRTLTDDEQRELCADGPRYKAIGNSKAVPCIQFVGLQIIKGLYQCY